MRVFNENKTIELTTYDIEKGYLKQDKLFIKHHEAVKSAKEQGHYETIAEYPNGGKDIKWVIDIPCVEAREAWDEYEDIQVFIPYTEKQLLEIEKEELRKWRKQYFNIIDCAVWYDCLNDSEKQEVKEFRFALLDITKTMIKPTIPNCVLSRVKIS